METLPPCVATSSTTSKIGQFRQLKTGIEYKCQSEIPFLQMLLARLPILSSILRCIWAQVVTTKLEAQQRRVCCNHQFLPSLQTLHTVVSCPVDMMRIRRNNIPNLPLAHPYHTVSNMRLSTIWQLHFRMLSGRFSSIFVSGLLNHPMACPPKGIAQHKNIWCLIAKCQP
jgi:hypothetical protein